MLFHLPSFLLGYGSGFATAVLAPKLKPVAMELATACYRVLDALVVGTARRREDLEDFLAEARARARNTYGSVRAS